METKDVLQTVIEVLNTIYETRKMIVLDETTSVFMVDANLVKELKITIESSLAQNNLTK